MSATAAIKQLDASPDIDRVLSEMSEVEQKAIIRRLMHDRVNHIAELKTVKAKIDALHSKICCPVADSYVFGVDLDRVAEDDDRRGYFAGLWQVKTEATGARAEEEVYWSTRHDFVRDPATGDMRVCLGRELCVCPDAQYHRASAVAFFEMISSQLLLYRLVSVFELAGVPSGIEFNVDGYKGCWGVRLEYVGDGSELRLFDSKGGASVQFFGSATAAGAASELVTWLVSDRVALQYDGTVAGTVA
jgi:hypothetical protein